MATKNRLISAEFIWDRILDRYADHLKNGENDLALECNAILGVLVATPAVDAVELPKGRPGDYLKWTNGVSERIFHINSIVICEDGMRYDLGDLCPFVNHPNILRIMSREEAEREMEHGKAN